MTPDVLPALASDEEIATFAERLKVYHEADVIGIKVGRGLRILARLDAAERAAALSAPAMGDQPVEAAAALSRLRAELDGGKQELANREEQIEDLEALYEGACKRIAGAEATVTRLTEVLTETQKQLTVIIDDGIPTDFKMWRDDIDAALRTEPRDNGK